MTLRTSSTLGRAQRGVSLVVVMIMLLLGTIVVLGSTRVGWLNEILVSSESDYQRAFAAAEALTRDAERDIKGLQADNITPCRVGANFVGCRDSSGGNPFFPTDDLEHSEVERVLQAAGAVNSCRQGICMPIPPATLNKATWDTPAGLAAMTAGAGVNAIAATYGLHTGAAPAAAGNPLLTANPARAWYWVEVFRYSSAGGGASLGANVPVPTINNPFVYRITAYVQGLKPGTRVWLRTVYVPEPAKNS